MIDTQLYTKISSLPDHLKMEVIDFVGFLISPFPGQPTTLLTPKPIRVIRWFLSAKQSKEIRAIRIFL